MRLRQQSFPVLFCSFLFHRVNLTLCDRLLFRSNLMLMRPNESSRHGETHAPTFSIRANKISAFLSTSIRSPTLEISADFSHSSVHTSLRFSFGDSVFWHIERGSTFQHQCFCFLSNVIGYSLTLLPLLSLLDYSHISFGISPLSTPCISLDKHVRVRRAVFSRDSHRQIYPRKKPEWPLYPRANLCSLFSFSFFLFIYSFLSHNSNPWRNESSANVAAAIHYFLFERCHFHTCTS